MSAARLPFLGSGNFSRVMRAVHRDSKSVFALKVIDKAKAEKLRKRHPNIRNEILMEKEVLNRINHPNVIRLFKTWSDSNSLYFLLEFAPGKELWHALTTVHHDMPVCIGFSGPLAAYYLFQVALGLYACHAAGVLHRDLKPENIVLCAPRAAPVQATADFKSIPATSAASSRVVAKLIDFGTAKDLQDSKLNGPEFVGTPEYIPPEVISGGPASHGMDLWALGVVLFQCLAGFHPFGTGSPYMTMQRVRSARVLLPLYFPPTAQDLLHNLLQHDPVERLRVWGAHTDPSSAISAVLLHPFWNENPCRDRLHTALRTLSGKLFPDTDATVLVPAVDSAVSVSTPQQTSGAAATGGDPPPPPPPPSTSKASSSAPAAWPAPPRVNHEWDTVQSLVDRLLHDEVLLGLVHAMHAATPNKPPPPPPQDTAPPPDADTTLEGTSCTLQSCMASITLERWLHWWGLRDAVQQLPPPLRQHVRHQLALRSQLWATPVIALFAPMSVCPSDSGSDVLTRVQRCLSWARLTRSGLDCKRFRTNTPPSGAAAQHENFTSSFALAVVRCSRPALACVWPAVQAACTAQHGGPKLRALLVVLEGEATSDGEGCGTTSASQDELAFVASLPLNLQVVVVEPSKMWSWVDGDEVRTQNIEWVLHGTRVSLWSPHDMVRPLEYAWWSDALDSSKYTSRHHVVVDIQGGLLAAEPLPKRTYQAAKRLLHHTSNTRAVISCASPAGALSIDKAQHTLHAQLLQAASNGQVSTEEAQIDASDDTTSQGTFPARVLCGAGGLTWAALDADEEADDEERGGWKGLLPEAKAVANLSDDASDSEDEHLVSKRVGFVPVAAAGAAGAAGAAITFMHFTSDEARVVPCHSEGTKP